MIPIVPTSFACPKASYAGIPASIQAGTNTKLEPPATASMKPARKAAPVKKIRAMVTLSANKEFTKHNFS